MIRWMCVYTKLDRIRNEVIREKAVVALIEEKLRETIFRWFEHVKRRSVNAPVWRCNTINLIHCRRRWGRSKMSWNEVIRGDLKYMELTEDMAQDKKFWWIRIRTGCAQVISSRLLDVLVVLLVSHTCITLLHCFLLEYRLRWLGFIAHQCLRLKVRIYTLLLCFLNPNLACFVYLLTLFLQKRFSKCSSFSFKKKEKKFWTYWKRSLYLQVCL